MTRLERQRKYRRSQKIARYGEDMVDVDMRGRHGNHVKGDKAGRWNSGRMVTSHGYVAVKVPIDHPHAWGSSRLVGYRYAYEHHVVVMAKLGRPLLEGECVHHLDGDKQNNDPVNLTVTTVSDHAAHHYHERGVDHAGRFPKVVQPCA